MTIFLQLKEFVSKKLIYKIVERKFKKKIFFFFRDSVGFSVVLAVLELAL